VQIFDKAGAKRKDYADVFAQISNAHGMQSNLLEVMSRRLKMTSLRKIVTTLGWILLGVIIGGAPFWFSEGSVAITSDAERMLDEVAEADPSIDRLPTAEAIYDYERLVDRDPRNAIAWQNLCSLYMLLGAVRVAKDAANDAAKHSVDRRPLDEIISSGTG
jgi:hypothetical protein